MAIRPICLPNCSVYRLSELQPGLQGGPLKVFEYKCRRLAPKTALLATEILAGQMC